MTTPTPGLLFGGGSMKTVGALPLWLLEHFRGQGDPASAYEASATTFRALEIRANTVAAGELKLYAKDETEIETHPLLDVLHNVNAEWNYSDLWRYTEAGRMVYGAGYWQKVRAGSRLKELFYLNPGTVTPKLTPRGIESFRQQTQGNATVYPRQDVVYFRGAYDPHSDLTGQAALKWLVNAAMGEGATEKWLQAFFVNGAVPAVIFATDKPMADAEVERAKAWWDRLFRGAANAFKTAFLGNGLKPYTVGSSIKDMQLSDVRAELRRTISIVTGVPEILFSVVNAADLTPVDLAMKLLYYTSIIPAWAGYAEVLNSELLTEYPDLVRSGAYLGFDTANIEVLQEDAQRAHNRLIDLVKAGIIKPEVAAAELGYDPATDVPEAPPPPVIVQGTASTQPGGAPPPNGKVPAADGNKPTAQRALASRDRALWQRKALNAMAKGKGAGVTFASDALSAAEHAEIAAALSECKTAADVQAVFERDEPPADDLAQIGRDLKAAIDRATEALL